MCASARTSLIQRCRCKCKCVLYLMHAHQHGFNSLILGYLPVLELALLIIVRQDTLQFRLAAPLTNISASLECPHHHRLSKLHLCLLPQLLTLLSSLLQPVPCFTFPAACIAFSLHTDPHATFAHFATSQLPHRLQRRDSSPFDPPPLCGLNAGHSLRPAPL